ncbi:hypothetical protein, partial [Mycobacterium kansasii]|uniref:hypothetical protein n=1 Tax=Mycobacterium kansasii TaxID=1768 RepID=UPI001CA5D60F
GTSDGADCGGFRAAPIDISATASPGARRWPDGAATAGSSPTHAPYGTGSATTGHTAIRDTAAPADAPARAA